MAREHDYNREIIYMLNQIRYEWRTNPVILGGSSGSAGGSGGAPGGVIGFLPQRNVAGDTTQSFLFTNTNSPANLLENLNNIRAWEKPSHNFWADTLTPETSYLSISSGSWYHEDGKAPLQFVGGNTPTLSAPSSGSRYDLLIIDSVGTLSWSSSAEGNPPTYPTVFPSAISRQMPLWMVLSRSSGSCIKRYDDGINHYIYEDKRPYLGAPTYFPSSGSAYINYQWYKAGVLSGTSDLEGVYYLADDFTLRGSYGYVITTPSSGSVIIDIEYSTNNGSTWTSVYSSTKLQILSGDNFGSRTPDLLILTAGTIIRAAIDNPGGGSADTLSVNLYGTIRTASGGGTVTNVSASATQGVSVAVTNPATTPNIAIGLGNITPTSVTATSTVTGSNLSGTNTGDQTITLTGDVTGSGTGTIVTDLSNTGVVADSYTSANITVDVDGRILAASSGSGNPISPSLPLDIADTADAGLSGYASAGDHVHRGVTYIWKDFAAYGAITLTEGSNITITQSGTDFTFASGGAGDAGGGVADGRLSLSTSPVAEVASSQTVYYVPYVGNRINLYNGSIWQSFVFSTVSLDISGLSANTNYDIFGYDSSGLTLEAVVWGGNNARGSYNIIRNAGGTVKSDDPTRRYLGTIRITSTSGSCADNSGQRFVWNMANRIPRLLSLYFLGDSHTYNSSTWRAWNASSSRAEIVYGMGENAKHILILNATLLAGDAAISVGIARNGLMGSSDNLVTIQNGAPYYISSAGESVSFWQGDFGPSFTPTQEGYYYYQIVESGTSGANDFNSSQVESMVDC